VLSNEAERPVAEQPLSSSADPPAGLAAGVPEEEEEEEDPVLPVEPDGFWPGGVVVGPVTEPGSLVTV
jgi:hypothetical protein